MRFAEVPCAAELLAEAPQALPGDTSNVQSTTASVTTSTGWEITVSAEPAADTTEEHAGAPHLHCIVLPRCETEFRCCQRRHKYALGTGNY